MNNSSLCCRVRLILTTCCLLACCDTTVCAQPPRDNGIRAFPYGSAPAARSEQAGDARRLQQFAKARQHRIQKLELEMTQVVDAARLISEVSGLNIVATSEAASQEVTLFLQDVTAIDAIETLAKVAGLWYRQDERNGTIRLMTTEEYQKDVIVFREDDTRVFTMLHPNAIGVAQAIQDLYGGRVILSVRSSNDDDVFAGASFGGSGAGGNVNQGLGATQGLGAGQSFGANTGTGRFSRPTGTSGSFGGFGAGNRILFDGAQQTAASENAWTPERIALIEQALGRRESPVDESDVAAAETGLPAEVLNELLRREPPIYVSTNRTHNLVIVRTGDPEAMKAIEQLILEIDRPTPEVLLEMKILEIRLDHNCRSIFDLDFLTGPVSSGPPTTQPRNPLLPGAPTAPETVLGLGNFALQGGNTLVYQFLDDHIRARVQLLETDDRVTVVATPLLMASNNRPARIFVGDERVLTTGVTASVVTPGTGATTSAIQPVTEVRDIGTTLLILPKIDADRTVTLFISQDSSNVSPNSARIPVPAAGGGTGEFAVDTISTANIQGTIVARDGLTVAIGGLIREEDTNFVEKVPFLGDLKYVGRLFRKEVQRTFKNELVLLITPHIITTPMEGACKSESRLRHLSSHPYVHTNSFAEPALVGFPEPLTAPPVSSGPVSTLNPIPSDDRYSEPLRNEVHARSPLLSLPENIAE